MLVVGLTGGIGSGKSEAARLFQELGAGIVDTDAIAHELTTAGGAAMGPLREAFGPGILTPEGALDRPRMRSLAFSDPSARRRLEAILHPMIRSEVARRLAANPSPYAIVVIPLLFETGGYSGLLQRIAVVDCSEETQLARAMARSRLAREEVQAIVDAQATRETRLAGADDVIENEGDRDQLRTRIRALHESYLRLAGQAQAKSQ